MTSAPSRIESVRPPEMPSVRIGISVPPVVALLALSAATIASSLPVPNSSGLRDRFFAVV